MVTICSTENRFRFTRQTPPSSDFAGNSLSNWINFRGAGQSLEQSTRDGYDDVWELHLKPLLADFTLGSFRPVNCTRILEQLRDKRLGKRSLQHIKSFLSGVYTFARTHGHFDGANPVNGIKLPKTPPPDETYAYSNAEEQQMLKAVRSAKGRVAIAVASWTGVDKGELEAIRWEDFKQDLHIQRKIWQGKRRSQ